MGQLQLVLQFEREKEQKTAQAFQIAQQNVNAQKQKLTSLEQYRLDYLRQIQQNGKSGLGAQQYSQHLSFVGKLDKACQQQTTILSQATLVADQRKQQWLAQQKRRKAVELLLDKQAQQAQQKALQAEQRLMDEFASQKYFRQKYKA
ncbi:flagellar export protein FliJ [Alteromonas aestuariivivens]|uniref:Flagellar FliJ protein n=1 Tax=Alteromonas aestuariivivens TaxID=1938339 RepID=A0A3D8M7C2_9ALTE|nr:flagellar export protein FliJ [Alteromonas aestuariivivens]RDV25072.1 flagellar export protein FliJ [Alteromonas aestuariivivens]